MKHVPMVSAVVSKGMILIAAACGIPIPALLAAVGLSQEQLADSEATLPLSLHLALWQEAALLSGDDSFGLHMGESVPRGTFGLKEYIIRNSPNLGAALRGLIRYQGLLIPNILRLVEEASVRVEHAIPDGVDSVTRHAAEFVISNLVRRVQELASVPWRPTEVWFQHARPTDTCEHERVFGCPVYFERPVNAFVLDRALLSLAISGADAALADLLTRQAEAILAKSGDPDDLVTRVKQVICTEMRGAAPTLPCIAVYQVRQQRLPLGEVAFLLGYSEVSAFHRAFRRWTGMSTAQFRKQT